MISRNGLAPTPQTWLHIIREAYALFDDLEARGFGKPPFSLGGGTALMLCYQHRLSKDVDLFAYDVQWISLFTPRLNAKAATIALDYSEQANTLKIAIEAGDIDFIVAADITGFDKTVHRIAGRDIAVDPPSEILAKKLFYRAAAFKPRDVYDMSAVIVGDDVWPSEAFGRHGGESERLRWRANGGRTMKRNALAMVLNAVSNASRSPVSAPDVIAILASGEGPGHLVRALYGDCSLETLDRLGEDVGLSRARIFAAYSHAKRHHGAANADMDAA